jgi:hypothetical protein
LSRSGTRNERLQLPQVAPGKRLAAFPFVLPAQLVAQHMLLAIEQGGSVKVVVFGHGFRVGFYFLISAAWAPQFLMAPFSWSSPVFELFEQTVNHDSIS